MTSGKKSRLCKFIPVFIFIIGILFYIPFFADFLAGVLIGILSATQLLFKLLGYIFYLPRKVPFWLAHKE
jgi:hypothetical protein